MKFYPFRFLLFLLFFSLCVAQSWGQTITVTNFDPGPYSRGSTVAIPFHIDDAAGCISQTNTFNLYLSNAAGIYSATPIASISSFYATFINYTIPSNTPAGIGYKFKIVPTTNPSATTETPVFTITTGTAVQAGITSAQSIDNGIHPEIFGNCNNTITNFNFNDNSTNATTINADFINESANAYEATVSFSGAGASGTYSPDNTNYTIIVRANNGITHATKAYTLINNPSNSNFGFSGTQNVCLGSTLTFNIDMVSANGIQFNYPGNTYKFDWGDGSADILTLCQIQALNGQIGHPYTTSSCGSVVGTTRNVFKISFEPTNPYCGSFNAVSTTARISAPPSNAISGPSSACAGVPVSFTNASDPGDDPNSAQNNCVPYANASYTWYVDGVAQAGFTGVPKSKVFNPTLTAGTHIIKLTLDNNPTSCIVPEVTVSVCVQTKPTPAFTLPATSVCLSGGTVTVPATNTTGVVNTCFINTYQWIVTGGAVTYTGGTSASSVNPQFVFTTPGNYNIQLQVNDACGDQLLSTVKQIKINGEPTATLSSAASFCGPQTLTFDNTVNSSTMVTYGGTANGVSANYSYSWSINGAVASTLQYPQLNFPSIGDYTVSVTYNNGCGIITSNTQTISIKEVPVLNITPLADNNVCVGSPISLTGTITPLPTNYTINWIGGTGTFSAPNSLNTNYTPSTTESGPVQISLQITDNDLPTTCRVLTSNPITINVIPLPSGTLSTDVICSGNTLNHTITSSDPSATYTWTAASTDVAHFTPSSNTSVIQDQLTLVNPAVAGTVTYTITPYTSNGCPGSTFQYKVTVNPLPVITLPASASICSGTAVSTVINLPAASNLPNTKYTWTATVSGSITGSTQNATAATNINDVLVNTGTTAGTVTYIFTPISVNGCPGTPSGPVVVTVQAPPTQAVADPAATESICNQSSFTLNANVPVVGAGKWTLISGQTGVTYLDDTDPHTTATGLVAGQTYQFKWTITSCSSSTSATVSVIDNRLSNGGAITATAEVCSGSSGDVTLSGNTGAVIYWETSTNGGTNWTQVANTTNIYHYTNLTVTTTFRATVQNGNCSIATSFPITVTVLAALSNNNITNTGAAEICYNTTPSQITGTTPQGGDGANYSYQWQQSVDGGNTYTPINGATTINYQPSALTTTTYFKRVVSSTVCSGATSLTSAPVIITVDPAINALFTAGVTSSCAPFNINQGNNITVTTDPNISSYTWYANAGSGNQQIGTGPTFPGYAPLTQGQTVIITLTVSNANNCQDSRSITFSAFSLITASFTKSMSGNCAASATEKLTVTFQNTSTPSGGNFKWDFGDGTSYIGADLSVTHDFASDAAGADKVYTVMLTPQTNCTSVPYSDNFTVYPSTPKATISVDNVNGCAPYNLTVHNRTLGTNTTYTYLLKDSHGALAQPPITKTGNDKSDAVFTNVDVQSSDFTAYSVSMVATNLCGNTGNSNVINISIAPSNIVSKLSVSPVNQANNVVGCVPFQVTLHNQSVGGSSYVYNIYKDDVAIDFITTSSTADQTYTFTSPGNYSVSIGVFSSCTTGAESAKVGVTVNALPAPDFAADATTNCGQLTVNFANNTPGAVNAPANSYAYLWDFGDGTTSSLYIPPPHTYTYTHSPYTVKLTATNPNGCSTTTTKTNYIVINTPAGTEFTARPDTIISIPNYHFSFADESTGTPISWNWDFGDGSTSTERNPEHTYADTGRYKVTLTTANASGCSDSKTHFAIIEGVPGQLYVPNAFMPTSLNRELRVFTVKGSGIKSWDMRIYNSWGQLIFETTKLSNKGEPMEFWDGKYKGQDVQQGGYAWEISATFMNGTDWRGMLYKGSAPKKSGVVTIIR